jgi:hypothetical protein
MAKLGLLIRYVCLKVKTVLVLETSQFKEFLQQKHGPNERS